MRSSGPNNPLDKQSPNSLNRAANSYPPNPKTTPRRQLCQATPRAVTTRKTRRRPEALSLTRKHERKTDRLFKTIRQLALKQVKEKPQLFLPLRQAARRFDVPVSTMAAIYRRLIDEGILSTVRASRTILRGRDTSRSLKVRGLNRDAAVWAASAQLARLSGMLRAHTRRTPRQRLRDYAVLL